MVRLIKKPRKPAKKGRPNPAQRKTSKQSIKLAARDGEILEMRLRGYTCTEIGNVYGLTSQGVVNVIKRRCEDYVAESAYKIAAVEDQRLEMLLKSTFTKALDGDLAALDACLKVMARRAKLLGLDAPAQTEISGRDGGAMQFESILTRISKAENEES